AHRWSIYTGTDLHSDEGPQPFYLLGSSQDDRSEQRSLQVFRANLAKIINFFVGRAIHALLLGEVPSLGRDPRRCVAVSIKGGLDKYACHRPATGVHKRLDGVTRLLSEVANSRSGVSFYSPLEAMRDETSCSQIVDSVYIYRDGGHLNRIGAEHLSQSMRLPEVRPRQCGGTEVLRSVHQIVMSRRENVDHSRATCQLRNCSRRRDGADTRQGRPTPGPKGQRSRRRDMAVPALLRRRHFSQ